MPSRFIFFTMDEIAVMIFSFIAILVLGMGVLVGLLVSAASYFCYKTAKSKEGVGFIQRKLFWYFGLSGVKNLPIANSRKYKG